MCKTASSLEDESEENYTIHTTEGDVTKEETTAIYL